MVSFSLAAGYLVVIGRILGPSRFGIYTSATAILAVVLFFGYLGLDQLYLRGGIDEAQLNVASAQAAIIVGGLTVMTAALWPGIGTSTRVCILLLGVVVACDQFRLPYVLEPQRRLDFGRRGLRELKLRALVLGGGLSALAVSQEAVPVATGAAIGAILTLLGTRRGGWSIRALRETTWNATRTVFRAGLPYAISSALYTAYFRVDMALLASLRDPRDVGIYGAAYSLVAAAAFVPIVLNIDLLRTRLYQLDPRSSDARGLHRRFGILSLGIGVLATLGFELLGPAAIHIGYGPEYEAAKPLVRILGLAMVPHVINSWGASVLIASGRLRVALTIQAGMLVTNVVGNLILIPGYGARGAAIMTVGTESVGLILYLAALRRLRSSRVTLGLNDDR